MGSFRINFDYNRKIGWIYVNDLVGRNRIFISREEFIEMIKDAGGELFACKATVDMFHLTKNDFCPQVDEIISVGQFYEKSAGAQIIFT